MLEKDGGVTIVGEAEEARAAYELVEATDPDVVVVDIALPGSNGIAVVRELVRRQRKRRVLVLTMHTEEDFAAQAFAAGAAGYALKHQPLREIVDAIREVAAGRTYCAPRIRREVVEEMLRSPRDRVSGGPLGVLSAREREVFDMLVRGYTNDAVATHLSISIKTVETHRTRILRKLHAHSMAELIRFAARHQLLSDLPLPPRSAN
jgi:DNA-binding NarL/FixJ family response regulator